MLRAIVLRKTAWRDSDLIVDLLTPDSGRISAVARNARRSRRRFGGALEIGTGLTVQVSRGRGGGLTLTDCDVVRALNATRDDFDRIAHLSYILEIARLTSREGEADQAHFGMVDGYLAALEVSPARAEALVLWQMALLNHLGYALRLGPCARTGRPANALSPRYGGAIDAERVQTPDALPITEDGMQALIALRSGVVTTRFDAESGALIQAAFARLWEVVTGHVLRTTAFLPEPT